MSEEATGKAMESIAAEEESAWQEFLQRPSSLPEGLTVTMTNSADEADAQKTGQVIMDYLASSGGL